MNAKMLLLLKKTIEENSIIDVVCPYECQYCTSKMALNFDAGLVGLFL